MLTATEHRTVQQEQRMARNARARSQTARRKRVDAWVEATGARLTVSPFQDGLLYEVRLAGFHPAYATSLTHAVEHLAATLHQWLSGGATHGPTGAALERFRAADEAYHAQEAR